MSGSGDPHETYVKKLLMNVQPFPARTVHCQQAVFEHDWVGCFSHPRSPADPPPAAHAGVPWAAWPVRAGVLRRPVLR
ncbi:hypothetical protein [Actinomadura gamaensis]|uniref:Uncharacterized protein n=1 Tax=Actinomadura gamaensis TaxID=1763541 RepID=A0ABV9UCC3_9ACTN